MRDLHHSIAPKRGISPAAAVTDTTAIVSQINDSNGYQSTEFLLLTGSLADTDATFTVLVEDGDASNLSDAAAVDDKYLLGTEALATPLFSSDNKVFMIGYIGPKRYQRVTITPAANTGDVYVAGVWVNGHPRHAPTANPPA